MKTYSKSGFILPKNKLNELINVLKKYGEIIAPTKKNDDKFTRMLKINDISEMTFDGLSWYSSKKEVFPEKQIIFSFNGNSIEKPKVEDIKEKVLFGIRMCDLNSFKINDKLFLETKPINENYKDNRDKLTLVGLWCDSQVDNYCFCSSMNLSHYYDLCLFDLKDKNSFHIKSASPRGNEILSKLNLEKDEYEPSTPNCRNKLMGTDIERFFERNDIWQKGSDKCLSCGDCTSLCPTCLCFDVKDEVNMDLSSGVRVAKWDSCMYRDFTKVAGDNVFRDARIDRFKHRFFHKLVYFPKKFSGELMCTGCGRCIRGCPTKIHWVCEINGLLLEEKNNNKKNGDIKNVCTE